METVLPKRKSHHLQGYDYSQNGAYFITICTHQRRMLFGPNQAPVGADSISARKAGSRAYRMRPYDCHKAAKEETHHDIFR